MYVTEPQAQDPLRDWEAMAELASSTDMAFVIAIYRLSLQSLSSVVSSHHLAWTTKGEDRVEQSVHALSSETGTRPKCNRRSLETNMMSS